MVDERRKAAAKVFWVSRTSAHHCSFRAAARMARANFETVNLNPDEG